MKQFAELVGRLDSTTKTNAKVEALETYLKQASDRDKIWCIALLTGKRPKRQVKTSLLRKWAAEASEVPLWLFEESYFVVGDLAETIALILPPATKTGNTTLDGEMKFLESLRELEEKEVEQKIKVKWTSLTSGERFVFNKLITGGFRIGVSQKLLIRALSRVTGLEEPLLSHRLMGNWKPQTTDYQSLVLTADRGEDLSRPYPFYLAYPLEKDPAELGDIKDWQAEFKWDGIRGQLIQRKGNVSIWSRGEELVTERFPELEEMASGISRNVVIDGEIMAWKDGKPLNFHVLQKRIGRKNLSKTILEKAPVRFMSYDLLEVDGEDLRGKSLSERRKILEEIVARSNDERLMISERLQAETWDELAALRAQSRENYSEGIMLKSNSSEYRAGRKRGDWWKWKIDPLSIDAVMIYAMRGHGRRANLYTDYTFAVWDGDELVPFAKAYSGLTDAEIREVDRFVKKNTVDRFGPVRSVNPELVFEIGFEGIAPSNRHKSGIALRFPRILRWRKDKKSNEANSLKDLQEILDVYVQS